jgi:hypothetical protein
MTDTQRKRDPRYTRTVGEKPDLGRRYVENGKVKIEWYEGEKRRSRTIGDNDAKIRREADEELERLLGLADEEPGDADAPDGEDAADDDVDEADDECDEEWLVVDLDGFVAEFRDRADAMLDVADDMAEAFERGLVRVLDLFRRSEEGEEEDPDVEDAEVLEEIDELD